MYDVKSVEENAKKVWKKHEKKIKQTTQNNPKRTLFSFLEGPPSANGPPGLHHLEVRTFKDIICKFKYMQGFSVPRKGGWDCHGLPIEVQVEKSLGLKDKKDIVNYGVEKFIKKARESVFSYIKEWNISTEELNYLIDLENPYITLENDYIESVWWSLSELYKKKFLYEGYKVVPFCTRCGTPLSSHEVAQGYKDVTEESVYVAFKLKNKQNEYLLAWTTTPWTLPGNVALAVGKKIDYVKMKLGDGDNVIIAKEKKDLVKDGKVIEEFKGKDLIGLEYEPLYEIAETKNDNSHKVIAADFVTTEDGTGVVHTAVMYGVDDYEVGKKTGLPEVHTVGEDGKFLDIVPKFAGKYVKNAEKEIIEDLKERHLLFKSEKFTHSYPFCWRCNTALLYYGINSWFISASKIKDELVKLNKKINWYPGHIRDGRFGKWLEGAKDWTLSRFKFWGTPLPIWKCSCGKEKIIGSVKDLKKAAVAIQSNKIYLMRHGESEGNIKHELATVFEKDKFNLTKKGKDIIKKSAQKLIGKIDLIVSSDFKRAKQTAEIVSKITGTKIIFDKRLREIRLPSLEGKTISEFKKLNLSDEERINNPPKDMESLREVANRIKDAISELTQTNPSKKILFVSHGDPLKSYLWLDSGKKENAYKKIKYPQTGELIEHEISKIDLHKPWIDKVKLKCECGKKMGRVSDVIDCWYDSGSATFAQFHYPFENKAEFEKRFPYDFISEAIDQTRGWFYTLHVISTILFGKPAYKNVICAGHVVDSQGEKMSKSKGNIIKPREIIDKAGVDAVRLQFCTSEAGNQKRFSFDLIKESVIPFLTVLYNTNKYYNLLEDKKTKTQIEDKWILSKLNSLIKEVTEDLENYSIDKPFEKILEFVVKDLSRGYIKMTREREDTKEVLGETLQKVALLLAPFAPYISEFIYSNFSKNSVQLEKWPKADKKKIDKILEKEFGNALSIIEKGLAERDKAQIGLKWPLPKATIVVRTKKPYEELKEIIKAQLNVKELEFKSPQTKENESYEEFIELDTNMTPELEAEGYARQVSRQIQAFRKKLGLNKKDKVKVQIVVDKNFKEILEIHKNFIKERTNSKILEIVTTAKERFKNKIDFRIKDKKGVIKIDKLITRK